MNGIVSAMIASPDFLLVFASLTAFVLGLCHLIDPKFAWSLHEMDARMFYGKSLKKAPNWQERLSMWGSALILVGGLGIMLGLNLI
ncbi:MAG: hypothetical protein H7Y09_04190 [Chitinophagaceae bacterium]|nr:hypothetical protein [Anaerolineae bacterium]